MEILRTATNPWGQQILVGVGWDLIWAALIAGALFVIAHALYVGFMAPERAPADTSAKGRAIPERVERHSAASRGFHWLMAAAMFVLLVTAFFPLVGIRFAWVTIHWIAGIALTILIAWHVWHAVARQDWRTMTVGGREIAEGRRAVRDFFRSFRAAEADEPRTGKYPLDQRLYHHAASLLGVGAIVTGILMMFRIDTFLWESDPYFLSDTTWGWVFVLHGVCGVGLITLVITHVYFAIRPEKRWMTRSMIRGWITREEYLEHYDPEQWVLEGDPGRGRQIEGGTEPPADPEAVAPA